MEVIVLVVIELGVVMNMEDIFGHKNKQQSNDLRTKPSLTFMGPSFFVPSIYFHLA